MPARHRKIEIDGWYSPPGKYAAVGVQKNHVDASSSSPSAAVAYALSDLTTSGAGRFQHVNGANVGPTGAERRWGKTFGGLRVTPGALEPKTGCHIQERLPRRRVSRGDVRLPHGGCGTAFASAKDLDLLISCCSNRPVRMVVNRWSTSAFAYAGHSPA